MALQKILKDSIGTGFRKVVTQGNDLLVGAQATVISTNSIAIVASFSNQMITVRGTVVSEMSDAIVMVSSNTDPGKKVIIEKGALVSGQNDGVVINGTRLMFVNRGTLVGSDALDLESEGPGKSVVRNEGTLIGASNGIFASGSQDTLIFNTGSILSPGADAIDLNNGNDQLTNKGLIRGDVNLAGGNDVYLGKGGKVFGEIIGAAGNDRFAPGGGRERIDGGDGTDVLDFRQGGPVRVALDGSFAGTGAAKNDTYLDIENVLGSQRADTIRGDIDNNLLNGFGGADRINAIAGQDTLIGGAGRDKMTGGGPGSDFFRYAKVGEGGDEITDFSSDDGFGDDDAFQISAAGFKGGLSAGVLGAGQFKSGGNNQAGDANDRFIFRTGDETLWFDRDGNKDGFKPVLLADLQDGAVMTAADIFIF
jgi:Ca2+-binding RTX toxin-like protein